MNRAPAPAELAAVGARVARVRRARDARAAMLRVWLDAAPWLFAAPGSTLFLGLVARAFGLAAPLPGFAALAALTLAPPLAIASLAAARVAARRADARDGLARLDQELRCEGRLLAAHEFLARATRTPFMEAAVADAAPALERARSHRLAPAERRPLPPRAWAPALLGLALALIAARLRTEVVATPLPPQADAPAAEPAAAERAVDEPPAPATPAGAPEDAASSPAQARTPSPGGAGVELPPQADAPQDAKSSRGLTGEGASATPAQASPASESQGFPSAKSQSKEAGEPGRAAMPKPRKPRDPQASEPPKQKPAEESGATAGRGVGQGSSRNPGTTDWESKDQVSTDEEDPLDDDEDVDEEDSESEARGGLQPSLRDRRPAVNRDLRIGFGNQPSPDANGRGSGGEQKKSRGVASLVLGVPIPDHVKGRPNPGRTKITQERVEPRPEDAAPAVALAHAPRSGPAGFLPHFSLQPWMRALVRGYFDRGAPGAATEQP